MSKSKSIDVSKLPLHTISEKPQKVPPKLSKRQQRELQKMFDEDEMENYFIRAQGKTPFETIQLAGFMYSDQSIRKVSNGIRKGQLKLQAEPEDISEHLAKEKISEEEQKMIELRIKREELERKLQYLDNQTSLHPKSQKKNSNSVEIFKDYKPSNVFSKEEHEQFVNKITKQREVMDKRHEQNIKKIQKSIQQEQLKLKAMSEKKMDKTKEKRRKQIQKSLKKKKQEHDKMIAFQIQTRKAYNQMKKKKFLHQQIEQKYQSEVLAPALEQKKKRLKQIREISKAFNVDQLKKHEKEYIEKRNQSFSMVKSKANQDWNYRPPQKTEKLSRFLKEEKMEQRRKLEEKKRQIDEKISRQEHFISYLKEKYSPTIDIKKQREMQERINKSRNKRRQSLVDSKVLGMSYLEQAKRLKRKTIDRPQTEKNSENTSQKSGLATKRGRTDYLISHRKDKDFYENKRRQRLEKLINSGESEYEKIKKLKREDDRISEEYQRKAELIKFHKGNNKEAEQEQALQLLLSGIKAKMGMIGVYNHKQETI